MERFVRFVIYSLGNVSPISTKHVYSFGTLVWVEVEKNISARVSRLLSLDSPIVIIWIKVGNKKYNKMSAIIHFCLKFINFISCLYYLVHLIHIPYIISFFSFLLFSLLFLFFSSFHYNHVQYENSCLLFYC